MRVAKISRGDASVDDYKSVAELPSALIPMVTIGINDRATITFFMIRLMGFACVAIGVLRICARLTV